MNHTPLRIVLLLSFLAFGMLADASNYLQEHPEPKLLVISMDIPQTELVGKSDERLYRIGKAPYVKVLISNNSDQPIKVRVVDPYYQNRPRLFKNGVLVPYRPNIAELVRKKDADPEFVRFGRFLSLSAYSSIDLPEVDLNDWYSPLEPGSYRLVNRYRLDINGPWTADSAPLLFEVVDKH